MKKQSETLRLDDQEEVDEVTWEMLLYDMLLEREELFDDDFEFGGTK